MWPASSVSGVYIAHPESHYFGVAKVERDQVEDYAARKNMDIVSGALARAGLELRAGDRGRGGVGVSGGAASERSNAARAARISAGRQKHRRAVPRRGRARQHRANQKREPESGEQHRPAQMRVPRPLRVREWRAPQRERETDSKAAQRASHERDAHRLRADTGERVVHDPHCETYRRDGDAAGQRLELGQADNRRQRSCDHAINQAVARAVP